MREAEIDRTAVARAAEMIQKNASGIVLSGRIVNGKVELDKQTLEEIARKFGSANKAFVAVNAPFDPGTGATQE